MLFSTIKWQRERRSRLAIWVVSAVVVCVCFGRFVCSYMNLFFLFIANANSVINIDHLYFMWQSLEPYKMKRFSVIHFFLHSAPFLSGTLRFSCIAWTQFNIPMKWSYMKMRSPKNAQTHTHTHALCQKKKKRKLVRLGAFNFLLSYFCFSFLLWFVSPAVCIGWCRAICFHNSIIIIFACFFSHNHMFKQCRSFGRSFFTALNFILVIRDLQQLKRMCWSLSIALLFGFCIEANVRARILYVNVARWLDALATSFYRQIRLFCVGFSLVESTAEIRLLCPVTFCFTLSVFLSVHSFAD